MRIDLSLLALKGKKIFTAIFGRILFMKKLIEKRSLIQPVKVDENLQIAVDESIENVAWTAAMPKGELAKLKKVSKK